MRNLRHIPLPGHGPEDVLMDSTGAIYCSLRDAGQILRVDPDSGRAEPVADTGGAPLGLDWLPDGRLLVCNAALGLQAVDPATGAVAPVAARGLRFGLCNNAHVMPDGTIFASDSSSVYPLEKYQKDLIEDTASGRLIRIAPDGAAEVLLDGLSFANGVVWLAGQDAVLVAETGKARIHRINPDGSGHSVFAETPGHPDNMSIGTDGRIWVAIPSMRSATLDRLHKAPVLLRRIAAALPAFLQPKPQLCCRVLVYGEDGRLLRTFDGDTGIFSFVTGVREHHGRVALGTIEHAMIALFDVPSGAGSDDGPDGGPDDGPDAT